MRLGAHCLAVPTVESLILIVLRSCDDCSKLAVVAILAGPRIGLL